MARKSRRERLLEQHAEQQAWIEKCGGTLAGYIRHYGDPGVPPLDEDGEPKTITCRPELATRLNLVPVPNKPGYYFSPHYGDGGTKIWEADTSCLRGIENELRFHHA